MTIVDGHLLILPYEQYGQGLLNPYRRAIMVEALCQAEGYQRPARVDEPHGTVVRYDLPGRTLIALVNLSGDSWEQPVLDLPDGPPAGCQVTLYARDCPGGMPAPVQAAGSTWTIRRAIPRLAMVVLEWQHEPA